MSSSTATSRRSRSSRGSPAGAVWSPVRPSTPAHWTKWLVHDSSLTLSSGDDVDDLRRGRSRAQPPAGHRELLAERVEDDAAVGHARAARRSTGSRPSSGCPSRPRRRARRDRARGRARRAPRSRRGELSAPVGLCRLLKISSFVRGVIAASMASKSSRKFVAPRARSRTAWRRRRWNSIWRLVDREAGVRVEDLVAGVHEGEEELARSPACRPAGRRRSRAVGRVRAWRGRRRPAPRAARQDAAVGAVAGLAVADRLLGRLDDVRRRGAGPCRRDGRGRRCCPARARRRHSALTAKAVSVPRRVTRSREVGTDRSERMTPPSCIRPRSEKDRVSCLTLSQWRLASAGPGARRAVLLWPESFGGRAALPLRRPPECGRTLTRRSVGRPCARAPQECTGDRGTGSTVRGSVGGAASDTPPDAAAPAVAYSVSGSPTCTSMSSGMIASTSRR